MDFAAAFTPRRMAGPKPHVTETPEFKRWFGESRVVGGDGKPLVVFHGTPKGGFDEFDPNLAGDNAGRRFRGLYFTNHVLGAQSYSGTKRDAEILPEDHDEDERAPGNYPVYLRMHDPYEIDFGGRGYDGAGPDGYDDDFHLDEVVERAHANGHDGVIAKNLIDEGRHGQGYGWGDTTYVVFHPHQVKHATKNDGSFDPENPKITKSRFSRAFAPRRMAEPEGFTDEDRDVPNGEDGHHERIHEEPQSAKAWLDYAHWLEADGRETTADLIRRAVRHSLEKYPSSTDPDRLLVAPSSIDTSKDSPRAGNPTHWVRSNGDVAFSVPDQFEDGKEFFFDGVPVPEKDRDRVLNGLEDEGSANLAGRDEAIGHPSMDRGGNAKFDKTKWDDLLHDAATADYDTATDGTPLHSPLAEYMEATGHPFAPLLKHIGDHPLPETMKNHRQVATVRGTPKSGNLLVYAVHGDGKDKPPTHYDAHMDLLPFKEGNGATGVYRQVRVPPEGMPEIADALHEQGNKIHAHVAKHFPDLYPGGLDLGGEPEFDDEGEVKPAKDDDRLAKFARAFGPARRAAEDSPIAKEPWEQTRDDYDRQEKDLPNSLLGVRINDKNLIVFQNPTHDDLGWLRGQGRELFPSAPRGEAFVRSTFDDRGNRFSWLAHAANHDQVEAELGKVVKRAFNQNNDRPVHRYEVAKAVAAGLPVPPEVLADYPDLQEKKSRFSRAFAPARLAAVTLGPGRRAKTHTGETVFHHEFADDSGAVKGTVSVVPRGDDLHVHWIGMRGAGADSKDVQGALGADGVRSLHSQLADQYPEQTSVTGHRITGGSVGKRVRMPLRRFAAAFGGPVRKGRIEHAALVSKIGERSKGDPAKDRANHLVHADYLGDEGFTAAAELVRRSHGDVPHPDDVDPSSAGGKFGNEGLLEFGSEKGGDVGVSPMTLDYSTYTFPDGAKGFYFSPLSGHPGLIDADLRGAKTPKLSRPLLTRGRELFDRLRDESLNHVTQNDDESGDSVGRLDADAVIDRFFGKQPERASRKSRLIHALKRLAKPAVQRDFVSVLRQLRGAGQQQLHKVAKDIAKSLGLDPSKTRDALHDSPSGAVPSVAQSVYNAPDKDHVRYAAAWYGLLTKTPSLAVFHPSGSGPDSLYKFTFKGSADDLRKQMDREGLPNRVLMPTKDGYDVMVFDPGKRQRKAVESFAKSRGIPVEESVGKGEMHGATDPADARADYRSTIEKFEKGPVRRSRGGGPRRSARDHRDFIPDIVSSPSDDHPRIAYADHLESTGDTGAAEIVRRQVQKRNSFSRNIPVGDVGRGGRPDDGSPFVDVYRAGPDSGGREQYAVGINHSHEETPNTPTGHVGFYTTGTAGDVHRLVSAMPNIAGAGEAKSFLESKHPELVPPPSPKPGWSLGGGQGGDRDAFIKSIAANPQDHMPSLVFADWLTDSGNDGAAHIIRTASQQAQDAEAKGKSALFVRQSTNAADDPHDSVLIGGQRRASDSTNHEPQFMLWLKHRSPTHRTHGGTSYGMWGTAHELYPLLFQMPDYAGTDEAKKFLGRHVNVRLKDQYEPREDAE